MSASADESQDPKPSSDSPKRRNSGTRLWLVTTTFTVLVLLGATLLVLSKGNAARRKLEEQYSQRAAHYAQESDLRIASYRQVASIVANAISDENDRIGTLEALAKTKKAEFEVTKKAYELAHKESGSNQKGVEGAMTQLFKSWENWATTRKRLNDAQAAEKKTAAAPQASAEKGASDVATAPSQSTNDLTQAKTAEAASRIAVDAATKLFQTAFDKARKAPKEQEEAGERQTQSKNDLTAALNAVQAARRALATGEELAVAQSAPSKLSFLTTREICEMDNLACYARRIVKNLVATKVLELAPDVIECPDIVTDSDMESPLLVEGQHALFLLPGSSRATSFASPPETSTPPARPPGSTKIVDEPRPLKSASGDRKPSPGPLCLRVPLEVLIPFERSGDAASSFDEMLFVEGGSCRVLRSSQTEPQVRLTELPDCGARSPAAKPPATASDADSPLHASVPAVPFVDAGGTRYQPFWQSVRAPAIYRDNAICDATHKCSGAPLLVVGLVRKTLIDEQIHALSPLLFLALVALGALALFSWPVAKLWLVGPHSRYSQFDSAFLATSALCGTFIGILLVLALVATVRLTARLERQIGLVADDISARIKEAMVEGRGDLKEFDAVTSKLQSALQPPPDDKQAVKKELSTETCKLPPIDAGPGDAGPTDAGPGDAGPGDAEPSTASKVEDPRFANWRHAGGGQARPICEFVVGDFSPRAERPASSTRFWVNAQGYEQIQEHDGPLGSAPVNVSMRRYFQRALEMCRQSSLPEQSLVVAEVVRSLTSIDKVFVIADATNCKNGSCSGVAGYERQVRAFDNLALPPGIEWAAIDRTGVIMLHSNLAQHHGHLLFDDLDPASIDKLHAAMLSKSSADFDGEYRGVRHRLRAVHNPLADWYVVALGSYRPVESVLRNTLTTTAVSFGLFVLFAVAIIVFLSLYHANKRKAGDGRRSAAHRLRLFPQSGGSRRYASAACRFATYGITLLGFTILCGAQTPSLALLIGSLVMVVIVASTIPGVWPSYADDVLATSKPAAVSQRSAEESEVSAEENAPIAKRAPQKRWFDNLAFTYTLCCIAFGAAFVIVPTTICFFGSFAAAAESALATEQLARVPPAPCSVNSDPLGACPKGVPKLEPVLTPIALDSSLDTIVSSLIFPFPKLMASLRTDSASLAQMTDMPPAYTWVRSPWELTLHFASEGQEWTLRSRIPRLFSGTDFWWVVLILLAALLLAASADAIAYASLKRLYFMDVLVERKAVEERGDALPSADKPTLLLFPSSEQLSLALKSGNAVVLSEDGFGQLSEALRAQILNAKLLVSSVDPLRRLAPSVRDAWLELLSPFEMIRGAGRATSFVRSPASFARLWAASDTDEQRVLGQLVIDGHASPHPANAAVIRHLAARGLVDPHTLTVDGEDLASFIRQSVTQEQMARWQADESEIAWSVVRVPLVTAVTIVLGVVGATHPDIAGSGALFLPPVAAGVPAVLRAVAQLLRSNKGETV